MSWNSTCNWRLSFYLFGGTSNGFSAFAFLLSFSLIHLMKISQERHSHPQDKKDRKNGSDKVGLKSHPSYQFQFYSRWQLFVICHDIIELTFFSPPSSTEIKLEKLEKISLPLYFSLKVPFEPKQMENAVKSNKNLLRFPDVAYALD